MPPQSPQMTHFSFQNTNSNPQNGVGRWNASVQPPSNPTGPNNAINSQGDKIKCVFIGDGAVGKTSLIVSYTTNGYPSEYVPTAIDTYDVVVQVDGEPVCFEMCDTPGQDDFDTLRPLCYPNTDVFLVCFSVVSPSSFINVKEKWIPEIKRSQKRNKIPPIVLVGTQSDLRNDATTRAELTRFKEVPVSEAEARRLAQQLGCESYIESSSLTQHNLKEVFDEAIVAGLKGRRKKEKLAAKKKAKVDRERQTAGCFKVCNIL